MNSRSPADQYCFAPPPDRPARGGFTACGHGSAVASAEAAAEADAEAEAETKAKAKTKAMQPYTKRSKVHEYSLTFEGFVCGCGDGRAQPRRQAESQQAEAGPPRPRQRKLRYAFDAVGPR